MLVGGYVLDVYCDTPGCWRGVVYESGYAQFHAESGGKARQLARRAGWKLGPMNAPERQDLCPKCACTPSSGPGDAAQDGEET